MSGAPVYKRSAPASITAVNDARRHCQTHWWGQSDGNGSLSISLLMSVVQRCKFTHPDTFRSPETSASSSAWSLAATICDNLQRLGRRAQPGRRRVGRQAARGAAHLCDPVAVERDPVDYGILDRFFSV